MGVVVGDGGGGSENFTLGVFEQRGLNSEERQNPKYLPWLPTHRVSAGRRAREGFTERGSGSFCMCWGAAMSKRPPT